MIDTVQCMVSWMVCFVGQEEKMGVYAAGLNFPLILT
jgi:hypothetical protein